MANPKDASIPGVNDSDLASSVLDYPAQPLVDADEADRFCNQIRRLADSRAQSNWPNENSGDSAVFVMVKWPRSVREELSSVLGSLESVLDPQANLVPLFGRLFILNRDGSRGFVASLPCGTKDILDWLENNGLDRWPVAILWRQKERITFRRNATSDESRWLDVRSVMPKTTVDNLLKALSQFHEDRLVTPGSCEGVWMKGREAEYVPSPTPEKAIQTELKHSLGSWFHGSVKAESEDKTSVGRIDIRLLVRDHQAQGLRYWAIIELKVFRSFHHPTKENQTPQPVSRNKNVEAMRNGLEQAYAYSQDRNLDEGFLEIYDLRKDKSFIIEAQPDIEQYLKKCGKSIHWNIRPLYGSMADYRKFYISNA